MLLSGCVTLNVYRVDSAFTLRSCPLGAMTTLGIPIVSDALHIILSLCARVRTPSRAKDQMKQNFELNLTWSVLLQGVQLSEAYLRSPEGGKR